MTAKYRRSTFIIFLLTILIVQTVYTEDIFQFSAPPGGVYLNSSLEQNSTDVVTITVEHEGVAIPEWFITADKGTSTVYEPRELVFDSHTMKYQIYKTTPPSTDVLKAPSEPLTLSNVISTNDFSAAAGSLEQQNYSLYFYIDSGQFIPAGSYSDIITLNLYTGDYTDSGTHVLADSVNITVYGRMAELIDIYSIREAGIRFMDLTIAETNKLIATVNERSNSATGYTVSLTSKNLANDGSGATEPYFLHSDSVDSLTYSLTYDTAAVGPWSAGTAELTDSAITTAPEWLSKELEISYSGSPLLAAGDYEDILTLTISAK